MSPGRTANPIRRLGAALAAGGARPLLGIVLAIGLIWAGVALVAANRLDGRLVRSDPDAAATDAELMRFGAAQGAGVYRAQCASCHGPDGRGGRARGVPDLTDADWLYGTGKVSDIEKVAYYGIRAHNPRSWNLAVMPAFARPVPSTTERVAPLRPDEIAAVTAFLRSRGGQPADAAAASAGAQIYAGKGGCYDCHTDDARGDPAIGAPNLIDKVWLYGDGSVQAISQSIAYGRQGVCPAHVGRLSALRLREVSLYVFALSHRTGASSDKARK
jgi:cytochrome c oxidase cbb3-type subunit 3